MIIIVTIPSILATIFNSLIYISVRSSTRRIRATTENVNQANSRDIYLLKHMLFIFVVFIVGWTPTYVDMIFNSSITDTRLSSLILEVIAIVSTIVIIFDLFFYNRDLRRYLTENILKVLTFI